MQQIHKGQKFVLKDRGTVAHTAMLPSRRTAHPYCPQKRILSIDEVREATDADPDCKTCAKILK